MSAPFEQPAGEPLPGEVVGQAQATAVVGEGAVSQHEMGRTPSAGPTRRSARLTPSAVRISSGWEGEGSCAGHGWRPGEGDPCCLRAGRSNPASLFGRFQHHEFRICRHLLDAAEQPLELGVVAQVTVADDPQLAACNQRRASLLETCARRGSRRLPAAGGTAGCTGPGPANWQVELASPSSGWPSTGRSPRAACQFSWRTARPALYDSSTSVSPACGLSRAKAMPSTPLPQPRSMARTAWWICGRCGRRECRYPGRRDRTRWRG